MLIGHINLALSMNGTGEHFIKLVEALDRLGARQHLLVANHALARRVNVYGNVTVGPVVKTPVMAYCLMPDVPVVHAHNASGAQAGLLLTLTRSIPYVVTRRSSRPVGKNPIARSAIQRSSGVICPSRAAAALIEQDDFDCPIDLIDDISHETDDTDSIADQVANAHMHVYRRAAESRRTSALLV